MPGLLLPLKEDLTHSDLNRWAPDPRGEITGKNYQESKFVAAVRSVQMIRQIIIGMRQYHLRFIIRQIIIGMPLLLFVDMVIIMSGLNHMINT